MTDTPHSLVIELDGASDPKIVNATLSSIDFGAVETIRVEIESKDPLEAQPVERQPPRPEQPVETETDSRPTEEDSKKCLGADSHFRKLLAVMDEHDSFLPAAKIRGNIPDDYGIDASRVSTVLYKLADRGLVEKKEADKFDQLRGNAKYVYKITGKGRQALERTREKHGEIEA